ncbi:uncharacterized protein Z520_07509 [Fonsecaea multimorphosa CBS 102226]|uniref:Methyltransferase domain-containing protein n=1 Tax=Fonsecaea multimorphosa CBS 102226 TaxID=1442371 RepID=A0A0D2K193_9EURO|nr:uncharacterized protein Z520_07509 [Fonsecaea multimorphosa CBS 102226]KIX96789.1 hypothetical protein Z520_07509 [Fonsecaea multimorphosa CBS 102226]OAL22470.1 hypothetical protein AYO22_07028 [Fonsecaea multimorphosa]
MAVQPAGNGTPSTTNNSYTQGHSNYTVATHLTRTAESDAAFLLPHIKPTDHILDVGCGPGTITTGLARYAGQGRTVGIDVSGDVLRKARALLLAANADADAAPSSSSSGNVVFQEGNVLERLPFADDTFDIVFVSQVLGHMHPAEVARRALREMRRVLKPGGVLATRDGAEQHFYPRACDLDRLWVGNSARALRKGVAPRDERDVDPPGVSMPALLRSVGFDPDDTPRFRVGASAGVFAGPETRKWLAWRAAGQLRQGDPFHQSWIDAGITQDEIEETLQAVHKWADTQDAWFAALQCEMLAWK